MNGKKAKLLRRAFRENLYDENGKYKTTADLRVANKIKKTIHSIDETGKPILREVERVQAVNANKYGYRKAKKAYKNGE